MKRQTAVNALRPGSPNHEHWIAWSDVLTAGTLLFCAFAALAPQRFWPAISRTLARVHLRLRGSKSNRIAHACKQYLNVDPVQLELRAIAANYEENIEAIREILPGESRCTIALCGSATIDRARQDCRGVVLWVSTFAHSDLVTKRGLARAGYALCHLSHSAHPYSSTWLGVRLLNPIRVRAENHYLERRVLVIYGQAKSALDVLKQVLRDNGIVTVTAIGAGREAITLPLLGGTVRLATGALRLALQTGAALIPVYTIPDRTGGYSVHCGPDLNSENAGADDEVMRRMAERYVELLETFVRAQPASWRGWFSRNWQPQPPDELPRRTQRSPNRPATPP